MKLLCNEIRLRRVSVYVLIRRIKGVRGLPSHSHSSSAHAEKMQALFRLSLLSFRACRGIPWKGTILKPDRGRSKAFPFPHGVSPVSVPLIAVQQGIHGKPRWAGTLSVSQSGAFSDCVTRFRGGALRHAKFPKTSYCLQLLDTL